MPKHDTHETELVTVQVRLQRRIAEHLTELAEALGSVPGRVLEPLIEREYDARAKTLTAEAPWVISPEAIAQAQRLLGGVTADAARDVLETAAVDAVAAEQASTRHPVRQGDGTLRFRGPKPQRFTLFVRPGAPGQRDVLVRVNRSGPEHVRTRRPGP